MGKLRMTNPFGCTRSTLPRQGMVKRGARTFVRTRTGAGRLVWIVHKGGEEGAADLPAQPDNARAAIHKTPRNRGTAIVTWFTSSTFNVQRAECQTCLQLQTLKL